VTRKRWLTILVVLALAAFLYGCASEPVGGYNLEKGAGPKGHYYKRGEGYSNK